MFDENARGALIQHLGYVPEEEKEPEAEAVQEAVVSEAVPVEKEITAEDLFATPSPMELPAVKPIEEEKEDEKEEKEEKEEEVVDTPEFSEAIKRCVVVGDFARAVDLCFAQGRFADALMIAMWGGDELLEQARVPSALSPHP